MNKKGHLLPRVTLAHVADRAGVSTATASLILSGQADYIRQFRPATVEKVRRSAERLGYRVNLFAAGLPTKTPPFFALVIRDFGGRQSVHDWHLWAFEGELLAGAVRVAAKNNLFPILATIDPDEPDSGIVSTERVIAGGVVGAVVRAQNPQLEKSLRAWVNRGERVVVVFPDQVTKWTENAVLADNLLMGQTAGRLLAEQGRRTWGFVRYRGRSTRETHVLRQQGLEEYAREVGARVEIIRLPRRPDPPTTRDLNRIKQLGIDGLFAADSVLSVDSLLACRKIGLEAGTDISLVGVNCSRWQDAHLPRITSIDISWGEIGEAAVRQLLNMLRESKHRCESFLVKPTVVPGATCPVPEELAS